MGKITGIWQELFKYWQEKEGVDIKCVGATQQQLIELEESIKLKIPEELKESLMCCNSYPEDLSKVNSACLYLGNGCMLYDTCTIEEIYLDGIEYGYIEDKNLIPIFDWNGNIHILICSKTGNIIYSDMEFGIKKVIFSSYAKLLEYVKSVILSKGNLSYKDFEI